MKFRKKNIGIWSRIKLFIWIILLFFFSNYIYNNIKKSVWDGYHQLNLVVMSDKLVIYSFHKPNDLLNILIVDPKISIPVIKNYGEYQIANIFALAEQEKLGGGKILQLSIQQMLGIPIDGYIVLDNKKCFITEDQLNNYYIEKIIGCLLLKKGKTNLSSYDLIRMFISFKDVKQHNIKTLKNDRELKELYLPDNSIKLIPDYNNLDLLAVGFFGDEVAFDEAKIISVENGTEYYGLANSIGRLVKNFGAEIINSTDADDLHDKSTIFYKKQAKKSYTLKKLSHSLAIDSLVEKNDLEEDIKIIIGSDFILLP